ncbi:hypothetical protein BV25DRAFT_1582929 [Artomyces pyxidatus]|uniref:Uncharacterized protein n=1 Tax=Artomyces pyxidatus TaxID=48021 RepID=A0ACB8TB94_9AGAM|nr:hypothetical protein BV25DRAFT_1582929 [Artomyces pyxidatus]
MSLTFAGAEMVSLCLESMFYGLYLLLFGECIAVLLQKRRTQPEKQVRLLVVSCSLFFLITWHEVVDAVRLIISFQQNQTTEGADLYLSQTTQPISLIPTSVYLLETIVSDVFMLYRCFVVWNSQWSIVILPSLVFVADCGTGIAAVYTLSLNNTNAVFGLMQEKITNSFFSCTLALNAMCTGLIAFRIWWTQYQGREFKISSNLTRVRAIVVESGAIYLATLTMLVAAYSTKAVFFKIMADVVSPIIGIVFSLIIVRVGRGISSDTVQRCAISTLSFDVRGDGEVCRVVDAGGMSSSAAQSVQELQKQGGAVAHFDMERGASAC